MSGVHWQYYVALFGWLKETGLRLGSTDPGELPRFLDGLNLALGELVTTVESVPVRQPFKLIGWAFRNRDPLAAFRRRVEELERQFPVPA